MGWWIEYYIFYVKHRDLNDRDLFVDMVLNQETDMSSLYSASDATTYHRGSKLNWTQKCLERVTECYFRDEGEAWNVATIDGLPAAKINTELWTDSIADGISGFADDLIDATPTDTTQIQAEQSRRQWEFMRVNQLTNMTYEDFLRTYGIRPSRTELHKPELIRYVKDWTYPSNTVDPTSGVPSSAASWAVAERADKDRFFTEPGFIFGVTILRPKVYWNNLRSAGVQMLDNAFAWLPAILRADPATSLRLIDNATGPLSGATNDYWVDVRDLFIYGDQFTTAAQDSVGVNYVDLPTPALARKYVATADIDGLFVTATTAVYARQDGIVSLGIAGSEVDNT